MWVQQTCACINRWCNRGICTRLIVIVAIVNENSTHVLYKTTTPLLIQQMVRCVPSRNKGDFPILPNTVAQRRKQRRISIHLFRIEKVTKKNGHSYYVWSVKSMSLYFYIWTCTFMIRIHDTKYTIQPWWHELWPWLACNKPTNHTSPKGCFKAHVATWQSKGNRSDQWWVSLRLQRILILVKCPSKNAKVQEICLGKLQKKTSTNESKGPI